MNLYCLNQTRAYREWAYAAGLCCEWCFTPRQPKSCGLWSFRAELGIAPVAAAFMIAELCVPSQAGVYGSWLFMAFYIISELKEQRSYLFGDVSCSLVLCTCLYVRSGDAMMTCLTAGLAYDVTLCEVLLSLSWFWQCRVCVLSVGCRAVAFICFVCCRCFVML